MKKLNNKGFAITVMLYSVLGIIVMTLMLILTTMSGMRKNNTSLINHIKEGLNTTFKPVVPEKTKANTPEMLEGMIPVTYNGTDWVKADTAKKWYDYETQMWANAVTVEQDKALDYSGNSRIGAFNNVTQSINEASFNGINSFISTGYKGYNFNNKQTYIARVKLNKLNQKQGIVGDWEASGSGIEFVNGKLDYAIYINDRYYFVTYETPVVVDKYYTIVATYDGATMKLFIDGQKVGATSISGNIKVSPTSIIVGSNPDSLGNSSADSFSGNMTNAAVYNIALSEENIINCNNNLDLLFNNYPTNQLFNYKLKNNDQIAVNTVLPLNFVNTMWVWIPKYEYKVEDPFGKGGTSAALPGEIEVNFKEKADTKPTPGYMIHSAFDFYYQEELAGIWVGKFETSGTVNYMEIKPNVTSLRDEMVSVFWQAASDLYNYSDYYGFDSTVGDMHMMKNTEWGAVAYLSQSKYGKYGNPNYSGANKEIYQNKSNNYITGSSNGTANKYITNTQVAYNVEEKGTGASTTGTIYGAYDMSGGAYEYVMGFFYDSGGPVDTEFTDNIDYFYYDYYTDEHGFKGDATNADGTSGWYDSTTYFVGWDCNWFIRGGSYNSYKPGIFAYDNDCTMDLSGAFRLVLVP
ncbi:MAG: LamG-like jellyroll fold domain-containing protein [Bacilli bacterium]